MVEFLAESRIRRTAQKTVAEEAKRIFGAAREIRQLLEHTDALL
jgi:hypothetical protein